MDMFIAIVSVIFSVIFLAGILTIFPMSSRIKIMKEKQAEMEKKLDDIHSRVFHYLKPPVEETR